MSKTRKNYTPQFKFDRAMEAIKTDNLTEISRKYDISVNVLSLWRKELLKRGSQMFVTTPDQENKRLKNKIAKLEQMLGKKEVELNVLKNFADFYESEDMT
jgi:transposase-like protein